MILFDTKTNKVAVFKNYEMVLVFIRTLPGYHKVSLLHRVWPFQAYKSHSSVWRILEVCNKRGYWTYVGIFFQKLNSECKILASCKFHKCSLEHIVLFKLIFQSQLIDIRTLHVVDRKEK